MVELLFSSVFFNSIHQMVESIIRICIYIFTFGVVVYFIALLLRLTTDTEGHDNVYHLLTVAFSAVGLVTYKIWTIWLGKLFVLIARAIFDLETGNIIAEYLGAFFNNQGNSGLQVSFINFFSLETLSSLSYFMVLVVYEIFVIIQVIVQIFFYLVGPVAIVMSLFPSFRGTFRGWLANFCAVNFWSILVAILFRLITTLSTSDMFQQALTSGDKGVLWESFILGVIICVVIILIPKLALVIFSGGGAAADLGSYGTGVTAGVVVSTVWQRLKMMSFTATQQLATRTSTGLISGTNALRESTAGALKENAMPAAGATGMNQGPNVWPFENTTIRNMGNDYY